MPRLTFASLHHFSTYTAVVDFEYLMKTDRADILRSPGSSLKTNLAPIHSLLPSTVMLSLLWGLSLDVKPTLSATSRLLLCWDLSLGGSLSERILCVDRLFPVSNLYTLLVEHTKRLGLALSRFRHDGHGSSSNA